jgi:hypothetical protein
MSVHVKQIEKGMNWLVGKPVIWAVTWVVFPAGWPSVSWLPASFTERHGSFVVVRLLAKVA